MPGRIRDSTRSSTPRELPIELLQVGDKIFASDRQWRTVVAITDERETRRSGRVLYAEVDGEAIAAARERGAVVEEAEPGRVVVYEGFLVETQKVAYAGLKGTVRVSAGDPGVWSAMRQSAEFFQGELTKQGKIGKRSRLAPEA